VNEIDGIVRGMNADQSHRQRYIVGTDFPLDKIQNFESHLFGVFDFGASRRSQPNRHLTCINVGKDFDPEPPANKNDNERGS
jgi:hypothetical protein